MSTAIETRYAPSYAPAGPRPEPVSAPAARPAAPEPTAEDRAALARAALAHRPRLVAVATRVLGNPVDAEDAVQDALVNALRAIGGFRGEAELTTWLHRVTVNCALMKLRREGRRREVRETDLAPFAEGDARAVEAADPADSALVAIAREEDRRLVHDALGRLPEIYRSAVALSDLQGLTNEEAARRLGVSPEAFKSRLHRARRDLARLLKAC